MSSSVKREATAGSKSSRTRNSASAIQRGRLSTSAMSRSYVVLNAPLPYAIAIAARAPGLSRTRAPAKTTGNCASHSLELFAGAREAPRADEQHRQETEERRNLCQKRVAEADRQHFDGSHQYRCRHETSQAVEPSHQRDGERLEAEHTQAWIEAHVAGVENTRDTAGERRQRPRQRKEELKVDASLSGEQRPLAGRAHLDSERRAAKKEHESRHHNDRGCNTQGVNH